MSLGATSERPWLSKRQRMRVLDLSPSPVAVRKRRLHVVSRGSDSENDVPVKCKAVSSSAVAVAAPAQNATTLASAPSASIAKDHVEIAKPACKSPVTGHPMPARAEGRLESLVAMGFLPGPARRALDASRGNLETAIDLCLNGENAKGTGSSTHSVQKPLAGRTRSRAEEAAPVVDRRACAGIARATRVAQPSRGQPARARRHAGRNQSSSSTDEELDLTSDESDHGKSTKQRVRASVTDDGMEDRPFDSDVSDDGARVTRRKPTQAFRELSANAQAILMDALCGPCGTSQSELRRRRVEVRQTFSNGCTSLKKDYWDDSKDIHAQELIAKSPSFSSLKAHQRVGVRWLLAMHSCSPGMILADEMGLGKTLMTLCFLDILKAQKPSVIIAPASLLENWEAEVARWTPGLCALKYHSKNLQGRRALQEEFLRNRSKYQLVITTPQTVHNKEDRILFFKKIDFEYLICDEAHSLKNANSARFMELSKGVQCSRRLLLTGTPIQNCLAELVNLLGFALSSGFRTQVAAELRALSDGPPAQALQQLQIAATPFILRRLKADVLQELPQKKGIVVYLDMDGEQRSTYDQAIEAGREACATTRGTSQSHLKDTFHCLRRICLHPLLGKGRLTPEQETKFVNQMVQVRPDFAKASRAKVERELSTWSDFDKHQAAADLHLDREFCVSREELLSSAKIAELVKILRQQASTGDKTLVFSQFTQMLNIVEGALRAVGILYCRLDGGTAIEDRHTLVENFQGEGGPLVFLVSLKAGGVGLNLTAANVVVMLDLDFNPQNSRQAEDRVHRLGQLRDVTIYYLVCRGTVEEMVLSRNVAKMQLDQHFGARKTALEKAAAEVGCKVDGEEHPVSDAKQAPPLVNVHTTDDGEAEVQAKRCELAVLGELKDMLLGTRIS